MDPDAIDRIVRKYAAALGLNRGSSAHSMRATFITTALENGAQLEDVQKAAGHRDPSTTKLYDRRGYKVMPWGGIERNCTITLSTASGGRAIPSARPTAAVSRRLASHSPHSSGSSR